MRVSIYARYSSDKQREASIEDQVRLCEERAAREGWRVVKRYTDHAISGASLVRTGIQAVKSQRTPTPFSRPRTTPLMEPRPAARSPT
jgi:DNA invertase Pin-like site-specific DNA recombinase